MVMKVQESQPQLDLDLAPGKRTVSRSDAEAVHHPPFSSPDGRTCLVCNGGGRVGCRVQFVKGNNTENFLFSDVPEPHVYLGQSKMGQRQTDPKQARK